MSHFMKSLLTGTAILGLTASPAFSQQLAGEVMEELVSRAEDFGLTVSVGDKTVTGEVVEWREIIFALPNGKGVLNWDFVRTEEVETGKVRVTYPDLTDFKYLGEGKIPAFSGSILTRNYSHLISGTSDARQHDFAADSIKYSLIGSKDASTWDMELLNISGTEIHSGADIRHVEGSSTTSKIIYTSVQNQKEIRMDSDATYLDMASTYAFDTFSLDSLQEVLDGKRNISFTNTIGSLETTSNFDQPGLKGVLKAQGKGTKAIFALKDGMASIVGSSSTVDYQLTLTDLPFPPFKASIDSLDYAVKAPLKKSETASQARYMFDLKGIEMSEEIWGMVDPTATLPRDKANMTFDVLANLKWLVDLMAIADASGMPAEVQDVTIQDITLELAGARLHGDGFLTLDNAKFPPEPVGAIDVDLKGGFGLLDKLMALGLVAEEQGQLAKMFSGMFTLPGGEGEDHLKSKIEMKAGGSILVNGNQIK